MADEATPSDKPEEDAPGFFVRRCYPGDSFKIGPDVEIQVRACQSNYGTLSCTISIKAPRKTKIETSRVK